MAYGWGEPRHAFGPRRCGGFHRHFQQQYFDPVYAVATPVAPTRVVAPTRPGPMMREIPPTPAEPAYEEVGIVDEPPPYPGSVKGLVEEFPDELRDMSHGHYQDPIPLNTVGKDPAYITVSPYPPHPPRLPKIILFWD
jgi:hypothetical protein